MITPYYNEDSNTINRCIDSVAEQTYEAKHFLVADGKKQETFSRPGIEHLVLSQSHHDYGNTPRCIGALSAMNQGYNAIYFLDADNWYHQNHIEEAIKVKLDKIETCMVASMRQIFLPDSTEVPSDHDELKLEHVDTSCMALFEEAFSVIPLWATMTPELSIIGDRIIYNAMKLRGFNIEFTHMKTVNYSSNYKYHFERVGLIPPLDSYELDLSKLNNFKPGKFRSWNGYFLTKK